MHAFRFRAATMLLIAIIATVALGPLTLIALSKIGLDWSRLSNIGQSYSGVSAILSAIAIIAVTLGIQYQSRQLDTAKHVAVLEAQQNLLGRAIDDIELLEILLPNSGSVTPTQQKKYIYCTMWLRYYHAAFMIDDISAELLKSSLRYEHFSSPVARQHWKLVRQFWIRTSWDNRKKHEKFIDIVEACHSEASRATAPIKSS